MNIASLHRELLGEIIKNSKKATQHTFADNYLGNSNLRYAINMPKLRTVGKTWYKKKILTSKQFYQLVASLIKAPSSTEKMLGGIFLDFDRKHLEKFDPKILDSWLNHLHGWAEIDTLCYGHFKVDIVLEVWPTWKKVLTGLNKSKNINKRRASIVLLCKPLTRSDDERLCKQALQMIDTLKEEKEILITKAISWTLRSMVKLHRSDLEKYLAKNKASLPAIAVRETSTKLKTGRKNG
ncbi:MAG TPA: DNA alkylation repair protein [Cyclobacteriaceae bacterium]|jgi:3-methyladenine DNA glycosylase AlkD|nr:DNA alkylation repair protein [Cyclobacteriaceae bacterium]